jgi:hypothetical protein
VSVETVNFSIFNTIIDALRLSGDREDEKKKQERVVYACPDREVSLEQEIKFLCRLVYLAIDELGSLEEQLMDGSSRSTGLRVTFLLLRCFQRLAPSKEENLKCLRYIVQALDSIFLKEETRLFLPIAIGLTETSKWSHSKALKPIIDACVQPKENNEESRQSHKLKAVLSLHLNHIVKLSDCLEQYFPTTLKKEDEKTYDYLLDYINSNNEERII